MKKSNRALQSFAIMLVLLLIGAQGAWADLRRQNNTMCSPKVHFKVPSNWTRAYIVIGGNAQPMPVPDENGWTTVDFSDAKAVGTNSDDRFFINSVADNTCQQKCVTPTQFGIRSNDARSVGFSCGTFETGNKSWVDGGEVWIQDHPDVKKSGKTYITYEEPKVYDFYIFLPNNTTWKSAEPYISETDASGKTKEVALYNDGANCGWYYRRYIDEKFPESVVIHRNDDPNLEDAIGMNGAWEEGAATPIALEGLFEIYSTEPDYNKALYFVADAEESQKLPSTNKGWYVKRPDVKGKCGYELAAMIYDTDASLHGAFTCNPDWNAGQTPAQAHANACYSASAKFQVLSSATGEMPCIGVTKGMVESTLDPKTKKMKLTSTGKKCFGAQADEAFAAMFNFTEGVNEQYCFNMPFEQAADGKFEFESDYYQSPGATVPGGFYPAEEPPPADMMISARLPAAENKRKAEGPVYFCGDQEPSTTPLGLRTIHATEGVPMSDLICNGPGWDGGVDCDGLFQGGSEFTIGENAIATQISRKLGVTWNGDGWAWSCSGLTMPEGWPTYAEGSETKSTANGATYRWTSGKSDATVLTTAGRNQHFCFESHANFRFRNGLKFSFRGDDDIWVFIDNKLAVDLGGTHLAAPGYVDLDKFMPNAVVGRTYDIDIYFCDRRTTMSNVHIKTNMFIEQTTGITTEGKQDIEAFVKDGNNVYKLCYKKSGGGSCAAAMGGGGEETRCDKDITEPITYIFSTDKTGQDPTKTRYSADEFAANPKPYDGGIDVSKPYAPVVNEDKLKAALPSNKYFLIIKIGSDQKAIEINIKGSLAVANREAVTVDENGNHSLPYLFRSQAMASQLKEDGTPDIDQMIPLYVAPMIDPCSNAADCKDPLEMQMSPGSEYSLQVDNAKAQFFAMKGGKLTPFNPTSKRTVGDGGIDTIYVTIPFDEMDTKAVETVHVNVNGSARKAEIKFFVPRLVFVDSETTFKVVTGDKDSDPVRMKGSAYEFYVVALNGDDSPCTDCNFKLTQGSKTSDGVRIIAGGEVVNGRAKVTIQSSKEYCRVGEGPACKGTATLHVVGPSPALMQATYDNMQFTEPPVPYPLFADIFDVHGAPSEATINVPPPYFSPEKEYLDGIGDSVVVYYHREFHKDSLPDKVAVFWESDKDSVLFEHDEVVKGAACGTAKGAKTDSTCIPRITLGGKKLSKDVKTYTDGSAKVKSWATYSARGVVVTSEYSGVLLDRIAPIIISARAVTDTAKGSTAQLKIKFSENVEKTSEGAQQGDNVFSFYINAAKEHHFVEYIPIASGVSYGRQLDSNQTILYSQASEFPQAGDYIHFRGINGTGLVMDQSNYKAVTDSMPGAEGLRPADEYNWNIAPAYDSDPSVRVPSPWALITGAVKDYAVRLMPDAIGSIPLTPSEYAKLPDIEAFTFDAYKDESDFKKAMINKDASVDPNLANYGFVPHGWFVKSDMSALIVQDTTTQAAIGNNYASVFFNYELQFFTNLGSHVVTKKGRIYCDDAMNKKENGKYFFEGKNCVDKPKNFFIVWNMKSNKDRLVGSGAYVAKLKTYVQLANFGKKNKNDKTEMWGVRHNTKVIGNMNIENSK
ncbi:MAG: fibro-slime domain-containing protein [Fibrobacter sp.]|nr:fibro-slime domain-containing protein [Fibrobacter sp.]